MKHAFPPSFPATLLAVLLPCLLLCQCQTVTDLNSRFRGDTETRQVIYERYYTMNGHRMVERRVIVTVEPRFETELYTKVLD